MSSPNDRSPQRERSALWVVLRIVLTLVLGSLLLVLLAAVAFFGLGTLISHKSPGSEGQIVLFFSLLGGLVVLVVVARSDQSLFPIVPPKEEPPTNVGEALGGLASGLGLDVSTLGSGDGTTAPTYTQLVTPYAVTNPIWLDIDGSRRFDPPGNLPGYAPASDPPGGCSRDDSGGCRMESRRLVSMWKPVATA